MSKLASWTVLLLVTAAVIFLSWLPYGDMLVYPIRLLVTYIHEGGHAIATIITGGHVQEIVINPDASGHVLSSGGWLPLIATSGYLGSITVGALIIWSLNNGFQGGKVLAGLGAWALMMTFGTGFGNLFGSFWGLALGVGLLVSAFYLHEILSTIVAMFLGVQFMLNGLYDLKYLVFLSATSSTHTDAQLMREATGLPATFWGFAWLAASLYVFYIFVLKPLIKREN